MSGGGGSAPRTTICFQGGTRLPDSVLTIKIQDVVVDGVSSELYSSDGVIVEPSSALEIDRVVEGRGMIAIPSFKNGHTHAPMSLLRGYADDLSLHEWLNNYIFPAEDRFDDEMIYWGTRLACLEMIKGGTTFCNDMYFGLDSSWRAFTESGLKVNLSTGISDMFDPETTAETKKRVIAAMERYHSTEGKVRLSLGLHAIYTTSSELIEWTGKLARDSGVILHSHLSETREEVEWSIREHRMRPTELFADLGVLSERTILAHAVWLSEGEIALLSESGTTVVHCPVSNMKLVSAEVFPYPKLKEQGVPIMLGTDGQGSNNNLDMMEEMKIAALLQKHHYRDPSICPANEILSIAQGGGSAIFDWVGNSLQPGQPADIVLIDPELPELTPCYDLASGLVYSVPRGAIDTVICGTEILMEGGVVPAEREILEMARKFQAKIAAHHQPPEQYYQI